MPRPRKPTALKLLHGEKDKKRINQNEPAPTPGIPQPPVHLDEVALACWHRTCKTLNEMHVLTMADGECVAMFCQDYSRWFAASQAVDAQGMIVDGKRNPALIDAHKFRDSCFKWLTEFGMTPASRTKLVVIGTKGVGGETEKLFGVTG